MVIYADNAATTKPSRTALRAMTECMESIYGNPSSLHTAGREATKALAAARETMAGRLGCHADEIYFVSGGSEANNQAILSAADEGEKTGKKHIVSSAIEHHSVLHTLHGLQRRGFEITLVGVHDNGIVIPQEVAVAIRRDTCLVTVMAANNEIGTVQPVAEIGELCHERGVLFHTDAVQAAGHLPINVERQHIDMLSLSAHKFQGPKGAGVLYARKGIPLTGIINGGSQERGKRAGTENLPGIVGMAAAFDGACSQIEDNTRRTAALRDKLIAGLETIPRGILNGDRQNRLPGNASFCFEDIESETLLLRLDREGIYASSGSACSSGTLEPSHVLLAIGRSPETARGALRLTLCHENTDAEVEYIIRAVADAVNTIRRS